MNVKARMFKNNRQVMLYLDIKGTSDLDCSYIDIDLVASYIGVNMYFRRQDVNAILNNINREKVMKYPYIAIQLDNIQTVEKRRVVFEITGHRMDDNKERIDFMFIYFMARLCV